MFLKHNYADVTITGPLNVNEDFFVWVREQTGYRKTLSYRAS
jgi:hypothetical protein